MGLFSCFGEAEEPERPPAQQAKAFTPLQPEAAPPPALVAENRRMQQLLEDAHKEIKQLTSRIKSMEAVQEAARSVPEVVPSKELDRTGSDDPAQMDALQRQVLEAQVQNANNKVQELELELASLRASLADAQQARNAADQAHQQALNLHQQTKDELQAARQELQSVQHQAASSAAAIDDLYAQTASFLAQQGVPTGSPPKPAGQANAQPQTHSVQSARAMPTPASSSLGPQHAATSDREAPARAATGAAMGNAADLQHTFKDLVGHQQEMNARVDALNKQIEVLQLERNSMQQAYDKAFDQGQTWREEVLRLESELAEAQAKMTGQATDGGVAAKATAQQADVTHQQQQQQQQQQIVQLEKQIKQLTEENLTLAAEVQRAKDAATAATQQASTDRASLLEAQTALAALRTSAAAVREASEAQLKQVQERLAQVEGEAAAAKQEATQLRQELDSHSFAAEGTAGQVDTLLRELNALRKRHAELEANMRMKDEMMGLLQTQLAEVADIDLDAAMAAAVARTPPLPPATYTPAAVPLPRS